MPDSICHLVKDEGVKIVATALIKNNKIINGIAVNDVLLNTFAKDVTITVPILVYLKTLIKMIPINRLMIETDATFLIPRDLKVNTRRNEPIYLRHILKTISINLLNNYFL